MTTKANVTINEKDYFIIGDGYPDIVVSSLKALVKNAERFGKKHNFSFQKAIKILSDENTGQYKLFFGYGYGFAEFEYLIGPRGGVYWRRYNNKCWRQDYKKTC